MLCSERANLLQVASLLSGHPILIEGFTAFLPDKTAFFQPGGRSEGHAHPLKGSSRSVCNAYPSTPNHTKRGSCAALALSTCSDLDIRVDMIL